MSAIRSESHTNLSVGVATIPCYVILPFVNAKRVALAITAVTCIWLGYFAREKKNLKIRAKIYYSSTTVLACLRLAVVLSFSSITTSRGHSCFLALKAVSLFSFHFP